MAQKNGNTGRFLWHELMTRDLDEALAFYKPLIGWTVQQQDMGEMGIYHMLQAGDRGVAGVMVMPDEAEAPPHWLGYCGVEDVDASTASAADKGAKVHLPPMSIPNTGRISVIEDPFGAAIATFAPESEMPLPGPEDMREGDFCWWELVTNEIEAAKDFYGSVFGWSCEGMDHGGQDYHVFKKGEQSCAGMMAPPAGYDGPAFWLYYTLVDDVHAKAEEIVKRGGQVISPVSEVPGMGHMVVLQDPTGAQLALFSGNEENNA